MVRRSISKRCTKFFIINVRLNTGILGQTLPLIHLVMPTEEMLDSLWAVFAQIRADQKKEEYGDILVMVSEIAYFLQNELGCGFPAYGIPQSGEFDF